MNSLKVLSYNIQAAIGTSNYRHYITRSWRHLLPHAKRRQILDNIASLLQNYDLVCLQEIDAGSFRSEFTNQAEYLAAKAGFIDWHMQVNRNFSYAAQHGIALLSRHPMSQIEKHNLPGYLPGRGALVARINPGNSPLTVIGTHLALSAQARRKQLAYLADLAKAQPQVMLLGDFNCHADELESDSALMGAGLKLTLKGRHTYPSWQPRRALDHILVSNRLRVLGAEVLPQGHSDHLPVATELELPAGFGF